MGLFGPSQSEKLIEELYPVLYQALERLKEARLLRAHHTEVAALSPLLSEHDAQSISQSLEDYAFAMIGVAVTKLRDSPRLRDRFFFNVAIQPRTEEAILRAVFGPDEAERIRNDIGRFDEGDLADI